MTASAGNQAHLSGMSAGQYVLIAGRFVVGYVLAVGVGALVFAIIAYIVPGMSLQPDPIESDPLRTIGQTAFMYFILGLVFGIPYTVLGSLAFRFWLPRTMPSFLVLGTPCPAVAIILMLSMMDGISLDWRMARLLLVTLPAGLAATYVYGAIGFGQGFGRWRFN